MCTSYRDAPEVDHRKVARDQLHILEAADFQHHPGGRRFGEGEGGLARLDVDGLDRAVVQVHVQARDPLGLGHSVQLSGGDGLGVELESPGGLEGGEHRTGLWKHESISNRTE